MSQDYHHQAAAASASIFGFSNGFERSQQEEHQQQIIAQQIRREKMRQGFEPPPPLVAMDEDQESSGVPIHGYDQTGGMLSEMFNFPPGAVTATELLQQQISTGNYQIIRPPQNIGGSHDNWYVGHDHNKSNHSLHHHQQQQQQQQQQQIGGTNINPSDSAAAAMHLFLMNPSAAARSPSPSPPSSSTLHMLLPNPSPNSTSNPIHQNFHSPTAAFGQQFTWGPPGNTSHDAGSTSTTSQFSGHHHNQIIEGHGQGLSLSLSSSLQHLEAAKAEEFRSDDGSGGMLFFNQGIGGGGGSNSNANANLSAQYSFKNLSGNQHLQGNEVVMGNQNQQVHVGFGSSSLGVVNILRTSKYVKAAQELLEEFCSVGRGQFKKNKLARPPNPNSNPTGSGGAASSSASKDLPPLSAADRIEHQRRKVKLLSMLDEVDRRYNHYCEQMQMVVNSFDIVMGYGAAVPYTALAQKAMSRHFRCLKDAIAAQIKASCELLGEKDAAGTSGVTKGETPRLKLLEQSLRQQRAFHQMGMMEQEAWRPQRGLPERSVNILRAWLFEHFLHPYPSDADKHLLARQTGLSRNQVSNWFINARVRLWKPMVEDMYQQESKEEGEDDTNSNPNAPTPTPKSSPIATTPTSASTPSTALRSEFNAPENDPSILAINNTHFSENQAPTTFYTPTASAYRRGEQDYATTAGNEGSTIISFGASSTGDVSLTLGLRHVGNMPPSEKSPFSVRDFGGC